MSLVPSKKNLKADLVLALGEHTGHMHTACGEGAAVYEEGGLMLLDAPQGCEVTHQEHGPVTLSPGAYDRKIVQAWDSLEQESRNARD